MAEMLSMLEIFAPDAARLHSWLSGDESGR